MLRLSRMTDYALLLLSRMARRPTGEWVRASDLSRETGIPLPTASKVLKMLHRGGILQSQRGVEGGYALLRPPREVRVLDVLVATEGAPALTLCSEGPGTCDFEADCEGFHHWPRINEEVLRILRELTLEDLSSPHPSFSRRVPVRLSPSDRSTERIP